MSARSSAAPVNGPALTGRAPAICETRVGSHSRALGSTTDPARLGPETEVMRAPSVALPRWSAPDASSPVAGSGGAQVLVRYESGPVWDGGSKSWNGSRGHALKGPDVLRVVGIGSGMPGMSSAGHMWRWLSLRGRRSARAGQ